MRKAAVLLLGVLALGACSKDAVSPADFNGELDDAALLAYSATFAGDPGANFLPHLPGLPDNLRLTADQRTQIKALLDAFAQSTKADRDALAAIMKQARQAAAAGKSPAEIRAILAQGQTNRENLQAAEKKLHDDIYALLTDDQKAWLDAHRPGRCNAPALSDEQKNQISALVAQFQEDNQADIDAVRAAHDQARAAVQSGASRAEVHAILEAVRPAMLRLAAAHLALEADIRNVLTPEQRSAHCGLPGRGWRPGAGMPGMPPLSGAPSLP